MAERGGAAKEGNLGCVLILVIVILAIGGAVMYGGTSLVTSESAAVCGAGVLEEGETCTSVSRSSGEEIDTFTADEARSRQDNSKDVIGVLVFAFGALLGVAGIALLVGFIYVRLTPEKSR